MLILLRVMLTAVLKVIVNNLFYENFDINFIKIKKNY